MDSTVKKTPLHAWHCDHGANMADFGGYEMPLWYGGGTREEHMAVLTSAGLFDTSHMAVILVDGGGARGLLQECFSKDLDRCIGKDPGPLVPGRAVYGAFLNEKGHVIDDALVYKMASDRFMVCVNAGMGGAIAMELERFSDGRLSLITDLTDSLGKIDIQGPGAAKILGAVLKDPEAVFDSMPYFSFKGHFDDRAPRAGQVKLLDGTPILLSRTGYTGEFGFELFVIPEKTEAVWTALLKAGKDAGIRPCGLASRDSLRTGAVLPLSHQDIGGWAFLNHPWDFALPWDAEKTAFTKGFRGDTALLSPTEVFYTAAFAGFDPRKVPAGEESCVLTEDGEAIGTILTCTTDVALGRHQGNIVSSVSGSLPEGAKVRGLSCGFVKLTRALAPGTTVVLTHGKRKVPVEIVSDIRPGRTARRPIREML
ncbi:aminomethyltransferase family protein [Desulfoluna butyratoxydans]|uniref:Glycine cleavage t-protein-like n-terminal n=1 Tax=Desulfoluna butyratoxydans TaxID=231438 RepID=A0A4U8YRH2_9BACT|nr:aminomethyltransferase family protein [Desulfoluna butyratoxydans]VFQ46077.1 glycine cleavage t-protein-like n-terminal [Desulfoluna butyratoxydans]